MTTAGTSIREPYPIIKGVADAEVKGLVVSVVRMERGTGKKHALADIADEFSMTTTSIVTMAEVVECLCNKPYKGEVIIDDAMKKRIDDYYKEYGALE